MNFGQMIKAVKVAAVSQDDDRARTLINDAVVEIISLVHQPRKRVALTLTAGVGDYDLRALYPDLVDVRQVEIVSNSGYTRPMRPTSENEITQWRTATTTGAPRLYHLMDDTLMLFPLPQQGDSAFITYTWAGPDLVVDSDVPTAIPRQYHRTIIFKAASILALDEDVNYATGLEQKFDKALGELQTYWNRRDSATPRRVILERGRRIFNPDPSADFRRDY